MNTAATFWVQSTSYAVRSLTQHMHQETAADGTATRRPTSGALRLLLDVRPHDVLLPTWAYSPHLALPARVVFRPFGDLAQALTLTLEDAYCVGYEEHFEPGHAGGAPAFYCLVNVVARRIRKQGVDYVNPWPLP